jgi:hypothetical protein
VTEYSLPEQRVYASNRISNSLVEVLNVLNSHELVVLNKESFSQSQGNIEWNLQ